MQIGRKLYFDLNGKFLVDTGERSGNVKETTIQEDLTIFPQLQGFTTADVQVVSIQYGERVNEFMNMGSVRLENGQVIIYPKLVIQVDNPQITTAQTATVTVTTQNDCTVNFQLNGQSAVPKGTINGQATFTFQSDVPGIYVITAITELYGDDSVEVIVVDA